MFIGYFVTLGLWFAFSCEAFKFPDFTHWTKDVHDKSVPERIYCPLRKLVNGQPNDGYRPEWSSVEILKQDIKETCADPKLVSRNKKSGYHDCMDTATYFGNDFYRRDVHVWYAYDFQKKAFWNDWVWKAGRTEYVSHTSIFKLLPEYGSDEPGSMSEHSV